MTDLRTALLCAVHHLIYPDPASAICKNKLATTKNNDIITHVLCRRYAAVSVSDDDCVIRFYLHTVIRFLLSTARIRAAAFLRAPLNPRFIDAMIVSFWCTEGYILTSFSLLMLWISLQLNDSHLEPWKLNKRVEWQLAWNGCQR